MLLPLKTATTNLERFEGARICKLIQKSILPLAKD